MPDVQIFGLKNSQATRAAQRFFAERRIAVQFVDLSRKAMAPRELKRFSDAFGLRELVDCESKAYVEAGLKYLKLSDTELAAKIEKQPELLRLPLVRAGSRVCVGRDELAWQGMLMA